MKKPLRIILSLLYVAVCLLVTRAVISNRIATSGAVLSQITEKTNSYRVQNTLIGEELYSTISLTHLSKQALELGFIDQKNFLSLSQGMPIAIKQ